MSFMFGPSLLICAVTEPMYYEAESSREIAREKHGNIIFKKERKWYDCGQYPPVMKGGQYVIVDAPIDRIPIFRKAGAVVPTVREFSTHPEAAEPTKIYV